MVNPYFTKMDDGQLSAHVVTFIDQNSTLYIIPWWSMNLLMLSKKWLCGEEVKSSYMLRKVYTACVNVEVKTAGLFIYLYLHGLIKDVVI